MSVDESDIQTDASVPRGYRRSPDLQQKFETAAAQLLKKDGYPADGGTDRQLIADLALEGGGVKGIALVGAVMVLEEAGYKFRAVAGSSAGAIAASLIAALVINEQPMSQLKTILDGLEFRNFMPDDRFASFLEHHCGKVGDLAVDADKLTHKMGLYSGDYLRTWLTPILDGLGVRTFGDLKLTEPEDIECLPDGHAYRLLVHTSDITRGQLVRLPWDSLAYGMQSDSQPVVNAVRASMSIPFFFDPVRVDALSAVVPVPGPGNTTVNQTYEAGTVTWVDGGMLRNFPINAFDRIDSRPPRWPTIGIKLSALKTDFAPTEACDNALSVAIRCLKTMMNEWDTYNVDATTAARTIFVDNGGVTATQFDLSEETKQMLFRNGVKAATDFVIEMSQAGVPRNAQQAMARLHP